MCDNGDYPKERYLSFVIPIVDEDTPLGIVEVKPYEYGRTICDGFISLLVDASGSMDDNDMYSRKNGRIVGFVREGTGLDTKYTDFFAFKEGLPLPDDTEVPDLYEYLEEQKARSP